MSKQPVVLLVAADGLTRQVTANGLAMYGYETLLARNGQEAVEQLSAHRRISVLVIDADIMGETSGLAVAKLARLQFPRIDVIYTSRAPHRIPDALRVKGAPCIRNPFQPQQIVGMISELRQRVPNSELRAA